MVQTVSECVSVLLFLFPVSCRVLLNSVSFSPKSFSKFDLLSLPYCLHFTLCRPLIEENEAEKLLEDFDIPKEAIAAVEESGIVFIDEIDKIVSNGDYKGADASSEGVQRDLLPLIEGSSITTKHGNVNTDFILFIASGAFHSGEYYFVV